MSAQQWIAFFLFGALMFWIGWAYGSWWTDTGRDMRDLECRMTVERRAGRRG